MDWAEFDTLRQLTGKSLSIHWEHDISSILTTVSPTELRFNLAFEAHIRELKNWTVGPEVVDKFVFLQGAMPVDAEKTASGETEREHPQAHTYNTWIP